MAMPAQALTPQISAGNADGFAVLDANGVIWTTGNAHGNGSSSQPFRFQGIADAKSISMGSDTFWIIRADDSLWGTGSNFHGELGTGNPGPTTFVTQPIKVLDHVRQVVQQGHSTYAIRTDGSLWAWGRNEQAQLGLSDQIDRSVPTQVSGLSNVVQVAAGAGTHAVALTADGKVWAMGSNNVGALGKDHKPGLFPGDPGFYQNTPQLIPGMDSVVAIAAASDQTFMLRADGTLWASGLNIAGSLGLGENMNILVPRQVPLPNGVVAVAGNAFFFLALLRDGTVWGAGANLNGQLGGLGRASEPAAINLTFLSDIIGIAVGSGGASGAGFALRRDGSIVSWGANEAGALGRGSVETVLPPGPMAGPGGVGTFNVFAAMPARINQAPELNIAFKVSGDQAPVTVDMTASASDSDGTLANIRIVGSDGQTALISGSSGTARFRFSSIGTYSIYAVAVDNEGGAKVLPRRQIFVKPPAIAINTVAKIRAGFNAPIVVNSCGEIRTWGNSWLAGDPLWPTFLPNGAPEYLTHPYDPRISTVVDIEAVTNGNFALLQSGQVLAWGFNTQGNLGLESGTVEASPTLVPALSGIVQISGASSHSLALDSQGRVYASGANTYGQLGLGDQLARSKFTPLPLPSNVIQIATPRAGTSSYALDTNGKVWAWGRNAGGELGSGNTTDALSPQAIADLPPIAAIFSAAGGAFALARDGTVWEWGAVTLPDPGNPKPYTPTQQPSLSGAVKIAAHYAGAMLKADGSVWTWGGGYGPPLLGDGSVAFRSKPAVVPGLTNVVDVSMSYQNVLALRSDGTVLSWGDSNSGQIGDGMFARRSTPVAVVNENADGYLNLNLNTDFEVPPSAGVPFFAVAAGSVAGAAASVSTTTRFNSLDAGKSGAVFITAAVPEGTPAATLNTTVARSVSRSSTRAASSTPVFSLIQLTASGWQPVVNGQLIAYASGVLGDQLAAQTILKNTDTTNLKGAQFCLGYGASADQMIALGTMRVVATIPDPNATNTTTASCIVTGPPVSFSMSVPPGWSLLGNSLNQTLPVASLYGDANTVVTVWKWDTATLGWQFYTPTLDATALQAYAASKGFAVLSEIKPGEGYWVNAKAQPAFGTQSGASFITTSTNLAKGWNLVATGNDIAPSVFESNLKSSLPGTGVTSLWAWDNPAAKWYFFAPSLAAQGGSALASYIAGKGYLDFGGKTLGNGTGFWVNR